MCGVFILFINKVKLARAASEQSDEIIMISVSVSTNILLITLFV